MSDYFEEILFVIMLAMVLFGIITIIIAVKENGEYIYECITFDNETITCDNVKESEAGLIGRRDGTSYLIKQYKKIKKEKENE